MPGGMNPVAGVTSDGFCFNLGQTLAAEATPCCAGLLRSETANWVVFFFLNCLEKCSEFSAAEASVIVKDSTLDIWTM